MKQKPTRSAMTLPDASGVLHSLLENLNAGILIEDDNEKILYANRLFCEIFRLNTEPELLAGREASAVTGAYSPFLESTADFLAGLTRLRGGGSPGHGEHISLTDGRVLERDYIPIEPGSRHCWIYRDISEQKHVERELREGKEEMRRSLAQKELLLREIHHRVKNNLQVISSLLTLQAEYVRDTATLSLFQESQTRVQSMALIHEKLYQSEDLSRINFGNYVHSLTSHLFNLYVTGPTFVDLKVNAGDIYLHIDTAIPCGLIVNELVSNSLKHAFLNRTNGLIEVTVWESEDAKSYTVRVSDDGIGLPDALDYRKTNTLGLQLVNMLTAQIRGTIEVNGRSGTDVLIQFGKNTR